MEKPELIRLIGFRLRAARHAKGISFSQIFRDHSISQQQILHNETRGLPNLTTLLNLCRIYGCTPGSILDNLPE